MSPPVPVLLVSLPFGPHWAPSLGLSLLKGALAERGIPCRVRYFILDLVKAVGPARYRDLALRRRTDPDLLGEWIASAGLQESTPGQVAAYVQECLRPWEERAREGLSPEQFLSEVAALRERFPALLDAWAEEILALAPRVVGFTSVFEQNLASLALARRLKTRDPGLLVVLGGANAEGVMGEALFRNFKELDLVFSGESEFRFAAAMEAFLATGKVPRMAGVHARPWLLEGERQDGVLVQDLDTLPCPDFSDYFAQHAALGLAEAFAPAIVFETSRGCWWGQKRHCTFCGLNGASLAYRSKSAERAFEEFQALTLRHPGAEVSVVDNILDLGYFATFVPRLAAAGNRSELFYEVKANLTKDQLRLLKAANITKLQPGIESLSDQVLRIMNKGVRGLQNVQLLKWCLELGLTPGWNFIYGFPGEDPEEYRRLAEWLPLISHLPPPSAPVRLRLDRFSPYHADARAHGLVNVRAAAAYRHAYRLPAAELDDLAYFFDFDYADGRDPHRYAAPLLKAVATWQADFRASALFFVDKGDFLLVFDQRPAARQPLHALEGDDRDLLLAADALGSPAELGRRLGRPEAWVRRRLPALTAAGLVLGDGRSWLALPVAVGDGTPAWSPLKEPLDGLHDLQAR